MHQTNFNPQQLVRTGLSHSYNIIAKILVVEHLKNYEETEMCHNHFDDKT